MVRRSNPGPVADPEATAAELVERLRALGNAENRAGQGRYGITVDRAFGVSLPTVQGLAREYRNDHALALALWDTGWHDARMLAVLVDDPAQVTPEQMDAWAADFDSWDITDQATTSLFDLTPYAWGKVREWSSAEAEYVKRAAFAMLAGLAVHDKTSPDCAFEDAFPLIEREAGDDRNFVKKAVNWALRNIGKRDAALNAGAVACALRILEAAGPGREPPARAARWIANDALRELTSDAKRRRLGLEPLTEAEREALKP